MYYNLVVNACGLSILHNWITHMALHSFLWLSPSVARQKESRNLLRVWLNDAIKATEHSVFIWHAHTEKERERERDAPMCHIKITFNDQTTVLFALFSFFYNTNTQICEPHIIFEIIEISYVRPWHNEIKSERPLRITHFYLCFKITKHTNVYVIGIRRQTVEKVDSLLKASIKYFKHFLTLVRKDCRHFVHGVWVNMRICFTLGFYSFFHWYARKSFSFINAFNQKKKKEKIDIKVL